MENFCETCPRKCKVNRDISCGFCGVLNKVKIGKVMIHNWEEPIISGTNGSGAVFFSGCNLKCIYCQNYLLSSENNGEYITIQELADIFKDLESKGVHNINLVTPTHYSLQIIEALKIYKPKIPIVWNTSGYEDQKTLKLLKDYVDIYLTDLKYIDSEKSFEYSNCKDYFEKTSKAIKIMRENQPEDIIENGIMKKGLIVRHLVLPRNYKDSLNIVKWVFDNLGNKTILSVMNQYTPYYKAKNSNILSHKVTTFEYSKVVNEVLKYNFENVFLQEKQSQSQEFIPDFTKNSD